MDNLARSRRVVTALRKVCPEFKPEWWRHDSVCPKCRATDSWDKNAGAATNYRQGFFCKQCIAFVPAPWLKGELRYIGPDLLAPAHLADLFEVCDAIGTGGNIITGGGLSGYATRTYWVDIVTLSGQHTGTAPTRQEALMLAAEAALGCGEEVQ